MVSELQFEELITDQDETRQASEEEHRGFPDSISGQREKLQASILS